MIQNIRLFPRNANIFTTLRKGAAYITGLTDSTQDILVMPQGSKLTNKLTELTHALQNGHTPKQRADIASECLQNLDTFRTSLYKYQQRTQNKIYSINQRTIDELHTAIVMYKITYLN